MTHRRRPAETRPASPNGRIPAAEVAAASVQESARLSRELPALIAQAETAGLSIIAQHLGRALALAERVAASRGPLGS